jgi:hypothetical protein
MPGYFRIAAAFALGLLFAGCSWETMDASWPTAAEAIEDGYVEKGWIPAWMPRQATGIRETHNLDSNASALSFSIPGRDVLRLPSACVPVAHADTVPVYIRRRWWPDEQALREDFTFFRCPADAADYVFVAVDHAGRRVLHWRTYVR